MCRPVRRLPHRSADKKSPVPSTERDEA